MIMIVMPAWKWYIIPTQLALEHEEGHEEHGAKEHVAGDKGESGSSAAKEGGEASPHRVSLLFKVLYFGAMSCLGGVLVVIFSKNKKAREADPLSNGFIQLREESSWGGRRTSSSSDVLLSPSPASVHLLGDEDAEEKGDDGSQHLPWRSFLDDSGRKSVGSGATLAPEERSQLMRWADDEAQQGLQMILEADGSFRSRYSKHFEEKPP